MVETVRDAVASAPHTNDAIRAELMRIIAREGAIDPGQLLPDATLDTIGIASHDLVLILMSIEETFDLYIAVDSEFAEVETLEQLIELLSDRIREHQTKAPDPVSG